VISSFRQKVQASTDWGKSAPAVEAPLRAHKTVKRQSGAASEIRGAPIRGHRLFPAFTALWFAALLGLGSLAIPSEALGRLVVAIHLPVLVPAAAPPLGFTAHLLVALLLTIVGGGLGLVLGLRLRPQTLAAPRPVVVNPPASEVDDAPKVRARDAHPDAPPRRPLVLTEAFGEPAEIASEEPMVPAAPLLRSKPGQAEPDQPASAPEAWLPVYTPGGDAALPPLDLTEAEPAEALPPFGEANPFEPAAGPLAEPAQETAPEPDLEPVQEHVSDLVNEPVSERVEPPVPVPVLLAATPQIPSGLAFPMPNRERILAGEPWSPVASAPLDSLGLVQLIERLALAIAARKAASLAGPPPPTDGAHPEVAGAAPEAEALSGPFARPVPQADAAETPASEAIASDEPIGSAREAILRRLGAVAAQGPGDSAPAPFSRPAQAPVEAVVEALVQAAEPADAVVPMRQPEGPVRSFAAPAPQAATPASLQTDEALRSALATLQRMSARG